MKDYAIPRMISRLKSALKLLYIQYCVRPTRLIYLDRILSTLNSIEKVDRFEAGEPELPFGPPPTNGVGFLWSPKNEG